MRCPSQGCLSSPAASRRWLAAIIGLAKKIVGGSLTQGVAPGPPRRDGAPPWGCDCCRRLGLRTATEKHRSQRKGRRSFETAIEYDTVARMAADKTRTRRGERSALVGLTTPNVP